jgi:hypothetical protein
VLASSQVKLISKGSTTQVTQVSIKAVGQAAALPRRLATEHMLGASFPLPLTAKVYLDDAKLCSCLPVLVQRCPAPWPGGFAYSVSGLACIPEAETGVSVAQYRISSKGVLEVKLVAGSQAAQRRVLVHNDLADK